MSQRVKGAVQQARGRVKAATGRLTGNTRLEMEGQVDRLVGALRQAAGRFWLHMKKK